MSGYLTPDNPPSDKMFSRRIFIPADKQWLALIDGALNELTKPYNWTPHGAMSVDDTCAAFDDIYQQFVHNQDEPPDWHDADDVDGTPELPWYEQLEDWVVQGFLAITFTPLASLVYSVTVPKLRLAFRTGNIGAIFRILLNGLEIATGDSYSPITDILNVDLDISAFAAANGLGSGPYALTVQHNGNSFNGARAKLEYVRSKTAETVMQTILEYDDHCGLRWSYDNGDTWTSISLAICADEEILSRIKFEVVDGDLRASLDGGDNYASICDVANVADAEIAARVQFRVTDGALEVSLDAGGTWSAVYDAKGIADTEITDRLTFRKSNMDLYVSKDGGASETLIYPFDFILQAYQGKLQASIDQGATFADIMDVKGLADTEIENQISFTQTGAQLYASKNGVTSSLIYDPGSQASPVVPPAAGGCHEFHVHLSANNVWRCPIDITTSTTIQIIDASGGWSDGSGLGAAGPWFCPNGQTYAYGMCQGGGIFDASDPLPSAKHMQLIALYGGVYFDPFTEYTVPLEVASTPLVILANDGNITDNLGGVDFTVRICSGFGAWCWDMTAGTNLHAAFTPLYPLLTTWDADHWLSGQNVAPNYCPVLIAYADLPELAHIDHVRVAGHIHMNTQPNFYVQLYDDDLALIVQVGWNPAVDGDYAHTCDFDESTLVRRVELNFGGVFDYDPASFFTVSDVTLSSDLVGSNPYGDSNCS